MMQRTFMFVLVALAVCMAAQAAWADPGAPAISISPTFGPPTTNALVSGTGFTPRARVVIAFEDKLLNQGQTDETGTFRNFEIKIPGDAKPGPHFVRVGEPVTQKRASTVFLIRTDWPQFLFGPNHTGWNPYENVLNWNNVHLLVPKWIYPVHPSAYSSPVVADNIVYIGSQDKYLCALNAATGTLLWRYATASYIDSAPAVVDGLLYANDGSNLYALNAKTGALIWKQLSGIESVCSSLTVAKSANTKHPKVLYVQSYAPFNSSHVSALDASNGSLIWSYFVGVPTEFHTFCSSPAVGKGVIYFGGFDGNLYALEAETGRLKWHYTTGGRIDSSPTVEYGTVFVGSDDKILYALNADTGALIWAHGIESRISSSAAVALGAVYVGSEGGVLHAFEAVSGAPIWTLPLTGALSSLAVGNMVVYGSTSQGLLFATNAITGKPLWAFPLTSHTYCSSPVLADGVVYFGIQGGYFVAFYPLM